MTSPSFNSPQVVSSILSARGILSATRPFLTLSVAAGCACMVMAGLPIGGAVCNTLVKPQRPAWHVIAGPIDEGFGYARSRPGPVGRLSMLGRDARSPAAFSRTGRTATIAP